MGRDRLRQRLKALLIVGSVLLPTFCAVGGIVLLVARREISPILWVLFGVWVVLGTLLGVLVLRLLRTFDALGQQPQGDQSNENVHT
jgi:fatty acid desaturase